MQRLLGNLVDNAIKFTPSGGRVEIRITEEAGRLFLMVSDTGSGIQPQDRDKIYKRFYRGDGSRSTSGNGLGLSLVKAIVVACGGYHRGGERPGCRDPLFGLSFLLPRRWLVQFGPSMKDRNRSPIDNRWSQGTLGR
jgi:signal transduction histidine kinase